MYTLRQYLLSLDDPHGLLRTLDDLTPERDTHGSLRYSAGNSAVVFRVRQGGRTKALRCYLRPMRHLRERYGDQLHERELYLYTSPDKGEWADVVLTDWIEGPTLQEAISAGITTGDTARLATLARQFDTLALRLLSDDRAHGDLKPENLVVGPDSALHTIDHDATYLPTLSGQRSPELGTAAYQHPARTADDFNARLDDYPAALISTALHALSVDPGLGIRHADSDGLLLTPSRIPRDAAYTEILTLFEHRGMALQYRIARLLESPGLELFGLAPLLAESLRRPAAHSPSAPVPQLFEHHGLWGFRHPDGIAIPPLYDNGFDFTEGLAAVCLGSTWHFIDPAGNTRLSFPGYRSVKPFRNGRAQLISDGRRIEIDNTGRILEI